MSEETKIVDGDRRANLEVIAPNVEDAVAKGLSELGLNEDDVEVVVLDEGSRGVLGIGSRQARVRLNVKAASEQFPEVSIQDEMNGAVVGVGAQDAPAGSPEESTELETGQLGIQEKVPEEAAISRVEKTEEDNEALLIARDTVVDLLDRMHIDADVDAYYAEPDDERSRAALWVDVHGEDLSILIGHRAETLNALQYITGLILGKELGRSVPLVVDVQGYRLRRAQEVRRVANQMAMQAVKTGRRQMLEPMPANERRLVHIELRKNPDVTTESVGEDPRRKVTITPVESEEDAIFD
jgi:spoIIIJ-associated protein